MSAPRSRRYAVLATVCLAAFAINLDTTIVNVALPDLARELDADHPRAAVDRRRLQPRLRRAGATAGSLGDRFGRRPALMLGLVGFAAASAVGALVGSPGTDRGAVRDGRRSPR